MNASRQFVLHFFLPILVGGLLTVVSDAKAAVDPDDFEVQLHPAQPRSSEKATLYFEWRVACIGQLDPAWTTIEQLNGEIRVRLRSVPPSGGCMGIGPWIAVEIGQLPPGPYELVVTLDGVEGSERRLEFSVIEGYERGGPGPQRDLSGLWWDRSDPGFSLSLHQSPDGGLGGVFATYDASGRPEWFILLPGEWTGPDRHTGALARASQGAWYSRPQWSSPQLPVLEIVGEATLSMIWIEGRFEYTIDGVQTYRRLERFAF